MRDSGAGRLSMRPVPPESEQQMSRPARLRRSEKKMLATRPRPRTLEMLMARAGSRYGAAGGAGGCDGGSKGGRGGGGEG